MCIEELIKRKTLGINYLELLERLITVILKLFETFFSSDTLHPLLRLLTTLI